MYGISFRNEKGTTFPKKLSFELVLTIRFDRHEKCDAPESVIECNCVGSIVITIRTCPEDPESTRQNLKSRTSFFKSEILGQAVSFTSHAL